VEVLVVEVLLQTMAAMAALVAVVPPTIQPVAEELWVVDHLLKNKVMPVAEMETTHPHHFLLEVVEVLVVTVYTQVVLLHLEPVE
jgi:hypothetical protein